MNRTAVTVAWIPTDTTTLINFTNAHILSYIILLHYIYNSVTIAILDILWGGMNDLDPLCHSILGSLCCLTLRLFVLLECQSILWIIISR